MSFYKHSTRKQLREYLKNRDERLEDLSRDYRKIDKELSVFKRMSEKIKQKNCNHYWIIEEKEFNNITGKNEIVWRCEDCRLLKDEYIQNKGRK